jgi:hypothetical protein
LGPIPNPQSPIPNPQSPNSDMKIFFNQFNYFIFNEIFFIILDNIINSVLMKKEKCEIQ